MKKLTFLCIVLAALLTACGKLEIMDTVVSQPQTQPTFVVGTSYAVLTNLGTACEQAPEYIVSDEQLSTINNDVILTLEVSVVNYQDAVDNVNISLSRDSLGTVQDSIIHIRYHNYVTLNDFAWDIKPDGTY